MKTRKEIKEEYKQMKFSMGVFQVKNRSNNKVFIDNSVDIASKWNRHKTELKFGNHKNRELQNDWNEKGEDNFDLEILSELKQDDKKVINYAKELKLLQQMLIDEMNIPEELRY
ncbi:GIY-YIG nuclease family protein [Draconibacterium sp. IB214405]|uniref:GIY-YIG nuclease family protein n=1 Tax=Draconibacterium sp. IB214405 TaxID=3097352 RepID=UPI002A11C8C2|nr:GIY-YIG nuclease family protein [Draconibacterium sp. IB214405]MDX8340436.1 GIY-YIG nuclease family protein [Draconibacterium sp. IB214405]